MVSIRSDTKTRLWLTSNSQNLRISKFCHQYDNHWNVNGHTNRSEAHLLKHAVAFQLLFVCSVFLFYSWRSSSDEYRNVFFSSLFFLQLLSAAVEFGSQWSVGVSHVLPPGEEGISGEHASWFGLLDHIGRLEKAPASTFDACEHSV